jgi:broad specificity phosphatase PhoE
LDGIDALVTSDLKRAVSTAEPLAEQFQVELTVDPDLRELDVGSWSGKSRAQIAAEDPSALDEWYRGVAGWDGGETYEQHEARAALAAHRIAELDVEVAIAVTHGGTLRALVLALLELDPDLRWRFSGLDHVAVTRLSQAPHGYRLVSYNRPVINELSSNASDLSAI